MISKWEVITFVLKTILINPEQSNRRLVIQNLIIGDVGARGDAASIT